MNQDPRPLIDTPAMIARVRDYGLSTTNQVVTMMMSGVFATSALAIADIMRTPTDFWVRLTLWFWFTLSAIAAMTRLLHGNLLIVHPSPWHVPVQLAAGFMIAASFAFISLSTGGADGWRYAYFTQLLIIVAGAPSVTLMTDNTQPDFFSAELRVAIANRMQSYGLPDRSKGLSRYYAFIPLLMVVGFGAVAAWKARSGPHSWMAVLISVNVLMMFFSVFLFLREVRSFKALLADIEAVRVATLAMEHGSDA